MISQESSSVLIVEDERIVAMDLQQTLAEFGYDSFAIASSTEEAIACASQRCPDIVLMDIRIKGHRDGIETAEILRRQFGVPVVYLTAHADEATLERAKKTEPHGYLVKPVKSAELRSVIEIALHRHLVERRLRERERWFSTTLRSIADAVVTVDLAGRITFMNHAAEALTGATAASAVGKPAREVLQLNATSATGEDESPLARALRDGRAVDLFEGDLRNASTGESRLINDSAAPVIDDKETLGAVMVFRDVTEQRKLQRQMEVSDRLASLGTMAAGVAHEVNNPLAVVVANTSYVQEELTATLAELRLQLPGNKRLAARIEEALEAASEMATASGSISRIVADLKSFSRPAQPTTDEANVARAVAWATRTTAHELRHRARVVTDVGAVPAVTLDETRLGQILINLLVNAAHAIEPGNVAENTVTVAVRSADHGRVVIEVRDTGAGIAPEVMERIFEPFFTTKPVGVGTGLGLSICHGIVTAAGGQLVAETTVGEGSVFRLVLPAVKEPSKASTAATTPGDLRPSRILVVDDEELVLRTVARVFKGHDVVCVPSAAEGLRAVADGPPFDVIFSDLMMPNMTGMEFYEALLRSEPDAARRIIFLTGGLLSAKSTDFFATVSNIRFEKPFSPEQLRNAVREVRGAWPRH